MLIKKYKFKFIRELQVNIKNQFEIINNFSVIFYSRILINIIIYNVSPNVFFLLREKFSNF